MQEDAPFVLVRMRVVKMLGRLGGKINRNLVTGEETQRKARFWMLGLRRDPEFDHC